MGWSYLRNKLICMGFRHTLWLKSMDANLYVESCDRSPAMKSNCFLEFSPIMESDILELEAYLYMYAVCIYIYIERIIFNDILIPPPKPLHHMPHHPTQSWQLPSKSLADDNPRCVGCQAAKPEFGSCETRECQLPNQSLAAAKPRFWWMPSCQASV